MRGYKFEAFIKNLEDFDAITSWPSTCYTSAHHSVQGHINIRIQGWIVFACLPWGTGCCSYNRGRWRQRPWSDSTHSYYNRSTTGCLEGHQSTSQGPLYVSHNLPGILTVYPHDNGAVDNAWNDGGDEARHETDPNSPMRSQPTISGVYVG